MISEMMTAIFTKMGLQFEMSFYPPKRALRESKSGKIDGFCAIPTSGLLLIPELMPIQTPITYSQIVLYGKATQSEFTGFKGTDRLIYIRGKAGIEEFVRASELKAFPVTTTEQSFKMIIAGRADYYVEFDQAAKGIIKKLGFIDQLKTIPAGNKVPIYIAVHRRHEHLISEINRRLIEYVRDTYGRETLIPY